MGALECLAAFRAAWIKSEPTQLSREINSSELQLSIMHLKCTLFPNISHRLYVNGLCTNIYKSYLSLKVNLKNQKIKNLQPAGK